MAESGNSLAANIGVAAGAVGGVPGAVGGVGGLAGLAALAAAGMVVAGVGAAIIVSTVLAVTLTLTTTTVAPFTPGRTAVDIIIPNQGSFSKNSRDINTIVCLGAIRFNFSEFNEQFNTAMSQDEVIGPYITDVNSTFECVRNRQIQWNLKFSVVSNSFIIPNDTIFERVQVFRNLTHLINPPAGLSYTENLNSTITINGFWYDDNGNPFERNDTLPTKPPNVVTNLKLGRTQMRVVVDEFGYFENLNQTYVDECENSLFTQSTSQLKSNLLNDKAVGSYLTDMLLFPECIENRPIVKIEFNIISYDYYLTPENIIKSLLSVSNQKISLPNEYIFKLNMKFNIIWFGSWFNENEDEIRTDPKGCLTNLADAFSIKYEEDSCFIIIKKDLEETVPEMMLETSMAFETNNEELREVDELPTKNVFEHNELIETAEYFKKDNSSELKYEFEEIANDDSNKIYGSF